MAMNKQIKKLEFTKYIGNKNWILKLCNKNKKRLLAGKHFMVNLYKRLRGKQINIKPDNGLQLEHWKKKETGGLILGTFCSVKCNQV